MNWLNFRCIFLHNFRMIDLCAFPHHARVNANEYFIYVFIKCMRRRRKKIVSICLGFHSDIKVKRRVNKKTRMGEKNSGAQNWICSYKYSFFLFSLLICFLSSWSLPWFAIRPLIYCVRWVFSTHGQWLKGNRRRIWWLSFRLLAVGKCISFIRLLVFFVMLVEGCESVCVWVQEENSTYHTRFCH